MDNINKSLETMERLLKEISRVNDETIKGTENLRLALLNLKIEDARIKENTGITPISNKIEDVINILHNNTKDLVTEGRKDLREAFKDIENYINEKEDADNAKS